VDRFKTQFCHAGLLFTSSSALKNNNLSQEAKITEHTDDLIKALELDKSGNWDEAHKIVQRIESKEAYQVHAYLHRKEGDRNNANYWYRRASEKMPEINIDEEWQKLYDLIAGK